MLGHPLPRAIPSIRLGEYAAHGACRRRRREGHERWAKHEADQDPPEAPLTVGGKLLIEDVEEDGATEQR